MLTNGLKELETESEERKRELDRNKSEISELLRRKHKLQQ